jgi:hypothetical protein
LQQKYSSVESKLGKEYKKVFLAFIYNNEFFTNIDFSALSSETLPIFSFPKCFDLNTFIRVNGQNFYTFAESLFREERQKLLLALLFDRKFVMNIDWKKCSSEILPAYLMEIFRNELDWDIILTKMC